MVVSVDIRDRRSRDGLSLVELLVAVAVIAGLAGLLFPGIQSAREAARATTCRNNLRQVTLATGQFETAMRMFPPARIAPRIDEPMAADGPTWVFRILPWLEETAAATAWDHGTSYAFQPEVVRQLVIPSLLCPTRRTPSTALMPATMVPPITSPCGCRTPGLMMEGGGLTDFGGNHGDLSPGFDSQQGDFSQGGNGSGIIISSRPLPGTLRWRDHVKARDVTDGFSRTLLAGEMHVRRTNLLLPPDCGPAFEGRRMTSMSRVGGPGGPLADGPDDDVAGMATFVFGSWHPGTCHFAFADGRVTNVSPTIDPDVLGRLCNRHDGHAE